MGKKKLMPEAATQPEGAGERRERERGSELRTSKLIGIPV